MVVLIIALVLILIIGAVLVGMYNGLIKANIRVDEAFADIETQLKRRHDLIPNLIETVKGYAAHEKQVFENVTAARQGAIAAQGPEAQAQAESQLGRALGGLLAVAEAYPDLKANQNFLALQNELTDTEDKIQASRRFYNMQVRNLNTKVQTLPTNLMAGIANVTNREFFEIEDAAERAVPQVSFS